MEKRNTFLGKLLSKNEFGTLMPLILIGAVVTIINPDFIALANVMDILRTASFYLVVGAPVTLLMITTDIDLSIGSVTALGGVITALAMSTGINMVLAILLSLLACAVVGVIKAWLVVDIKLPAMMVTLSLLYVIKGIVMVITKGLFISVNSEPFKILGQLKIFGQVHLTVIIALLIAAVFQLILSKTKYGRSVFAVGGNAECARLAGIPVKRRRRQLHIIVSVFAGFAGILMASRFASAQATAGSGSELSVLASVIIGGASLYGGAGSVVGTTLGCILLAVVNNGLILARVDSFWQSFIYGLILLISIGIDKYRQNISSAS